MEANATARLGERPSARFASFAQRPQVVADAEDGDIEFAQGAAEKLIAVPALVAGALVVLIMALLWRALCEFYVAIFRISDDLRALREAGDAGRGPFA